MYYPDLIRSARLAIAEFNTQLKIKFLAVSACTENISKQRWLIVLTADGRKCFQGL